MNRHSSAVDAARFLPVIRRESVSEPHAQELNASFDLRCGSAELTNPKELSRDPSSQPQYAVIDMYMFNVISDSTVSFVSVTFIGTELVHKK